jgi:hypothetical protein
MDNINAPNILILENKVLKGKLHIPCFFFSSFLLWKILSSYFICALLNELFWYSK